MSAAGLSKMSISESSGPASASKKRKDDDDEDEVEETEEETEEEKRCSELSKEELWSAYESSSDRKVKTILIHVALSGKAKPGQEKAHWMDKELIAHAILKVHGNTNKPSRAYLTALASALAEANHRSATIPQNRKKDRAVVKRLLEATSENVYEPAKNSLIKLRHQIEWMKANVRCISAPILKSLLKLYDNVYVPASKQGTKEVNSYPLLNEYFPTDEARETFEGQSLSTQQVKSLEAKVEKEWAIEECHKELRNLEKAQAEEKRELLLKLQQKFKEEREEKIQQLLHEKGLKAKDLDLNA